MNIEDNHMIRNDPFYILDIPMTAGSRQIFAAAEEMSLLEDPAKCEDAAAALISPAKRLEAELDWFPETGEDTIRNIRESISCSRAIDSSIITELTGISRANAAVYDLILEASGGASPDAGIAPHIIEIDEGFRSCSPEDLLDAINAKRQAAGITAAGADGLEEALSEKKTRIASELSQILSQLDDEEYVDLINLLSGYLRDDPSASVGSMIPELIDRYELQKQTLIQSRTRKFLRDTFRLKLIAMIFDIGGKLGAFCAGLEAWLRYVEPLKTVASLRGTENQFVVSAAMDIRELVKIVSKNKNELTAYKLAGLLLEYFADMPSVTEVLERDRKDAARFIWNIYRKTPEEFEQREKKARGVIFKILLISVISASVMVIIRTVVTFF